MKAEIYNYQTWIATTDPVEIEASMEDMLNLAGFRILKKSTHHFQPHGFTAVWLLAESHLAVHSFPESGKTYIELSSCNAAKNRHFINLIARESIIVEEKQETHG